MKKPFAIAVEVPCSQSWEEMQPMHCGRYCQSCQKTVLDFTALSDEELIRYFQQRQTASCGKFTEQQLSKVFPPKPKRLTFRSVNKYMAASLFAALGLSYKASAQRKDTPITQGIFDSKPDNIQFEKLAVIRGTVRDEHGEGIPGAALTLKGTHTGTVTDSDGKFELELPQQDEHYTIICETLTFIKQEIVVSLPGEINIVVEKDMSPSDITELMGMVGTYSIIKQDEPTLWKRLTKPFRKKIK